MISVQWEGVAEVSNRMQAVLNQLAPLLVQAIQQEAERILDQSIPLVPIDTGLLVSSGMVEAQPQGADIRYGGHGLAPYAAIVEFSTEMNHPNGGQAFFLSQPYFAAVGGMEQRLAQDMAARLGG